MFLKKAKRVPRKIRRIFANLPYESRTWWVNNVTRKPIWYTDQFGITSQLRPNENIKHVFLSRSHYDDIGVIKLLQRIVKPGMTIIDVGANKGDFALHAAKLAGSTGKVIAFEPVQYTFNYLQENISQTPAAAKIIELNRFAVGNSVGEITINTFPESFFGWNTLGNPTMEYQGQQITPTKSEIVPITTLDAFCEKRGINNIDLLKIDVEGFEPEVIAGASTLLASKRIHHIIFEISLAPLQGSGRNGQDVLLEFTSRNLVTGKINSDGSLKEIGEIETFEIPFFANYLAIPKVL